jgi:glycosyltransferase involved in cell wall biosynthesis
VLRRRYLLISPIPYFEGGDGSIWLERLWHRDLVAHLNYLQHLTVIAPRRTNPEHADLLKVTAPEGVVLSFVGLPFVDSALNALLLMPQTSITLFRQIRVADIVHSGVAGWPYPMGIFANPMALLLGKKLIVVIESSAWRRSGATQASLKARLRSRLTENFAKWSVNHADLSIFTSRAYCESLKSGGSGATMINPASWIDENDILSDDSAMASWAAKPEKLHLLFAGRLIRDKGLLVLLDAMREIERHGVELHLDIIGEGPLERDCAEAAQSLMKAKLNVLRPTTYGEPFFALLRRYHAVVVPSLSDEQPRVIYDAYSQAVPVLASDASGHRECVRDNETGALFRKNDIEALAAVLERYVSQPSLLRELGMSGLLVARQMTHSVMHSTRARVLEALFGAEPGPAR